MSKYNAYQTTKEDLEILKKMKSVNERAEWIRKKASSVNDENLSASKVAQEIGVVPSVLAKLEYGHTKNPSLEMIQNLCKFFIIPIGVLFDDYYLEAKPFTIFGPGETIVNHEPLFKEAYQVKILVEIASLTGEAKETVEEDLFLSPLEIDEFKNEIQFLIDKLLKRKMKWNRQMDALNTLTSKNNDQFKETDFEKEELDGSVK